MTSQILWSVTTRAICQQGLVQSRARGVLDLKSEPPPQIRASTAFQSVAVVRFGNWIAANLPWRRDWRTAIERAPTRALAVRRFLQEYAGTGVLGFCNLLRRLKAAGSLSFLRSLVQHPQKSGRSGFHAFRLSPVLCSSVAHKSNTDRRTRRDVGAVRQG